MKTAITGFVLIAVALIAFVVCFTTFYVGGPGLKVNHVKLWGSVLSIGVGIVGVFLVVASRHQAMMRSGESAQWMSLYASSMFHRALSVERRSGCNSMSDNEPDISVWLSWEDGLPRPQWDLIETWVESQHEPPARCGAWAGVGRQWLAELGKALGEGYETIECDNFLALVASEGGSGRVGGAGHRLLRFAERCRAVLLSGLGGVAEFDAHSKQILIVPQNEDHYYRYLSLYYPEGEHGGSAGIHIRQGYPHVVLHGKELWALENTLAHELTHVCLQHLSMPQWLEEGLAQMFEHNMTGRQLVEVNVEMVGRHQRYWGRHGLDAFWRGEGFSRPGKIQELSYQLAEILVRLLVEESRPRWFGWVREPQERFFAFLREASASDCGAASCQEHLRYELSELAARFLGAGAWSPSL